MRLGLQNAFVLYIVSWYCPDGHGRQTLSVVAFVCWRYIPLEVQYCRLGLQVLSVVKYSPGVHCTVFSGGDCIGCKTNTKGTWHARRVSSRPAQAAPNKGACGAVIILQNVDESRWRETYVQHTARTTGAYSGVRIHTFACCDQYVVNASASSGCQYCLTSRKQHTF